ncbi:DsrE family protein [Streptomyces hygroscopicus]|uniref:DsrE family protein n=1 Tax=Streptomyces hygroscopicus TaxID=1912 RepID=UPI0007671C7C|nr:DsrE family protein [Streptomyces hygroscopicus]MBW8093470.1 DsrE family protein [Streptomyces hygroscopicus subsp. hygroscopicus]
MARPVPRTDVLLNLFGAPHQTDLVTSALRLATALLDRGARVQIWTCGDATRLTCAALGEAKPRDYTDLGRDHPSTARVVRELIAGHPDRLYWYVCRFCAQERGAADQIPQVRKRAPFVFAEHVSAADKSLLMGVC